MKNDRILVTNLLLTKSIKEIHQETDIPLSTLYKWKKESELVSNDKRILTKPVSQKTFIELKQTLDKKINEVQILQSCIKHLSLSNKEKYKIISSLEDKYYIHTLCDALGLRRSSYYHYKRSQKIANERQKKDEIYEKEIIQIFNDSKQRFGAKKIKVKLEENNIILGKKKISQVMRKHKLIPKANRPYKKSYPRSNFYKNKVNGEFTQEHPNKVWVSDITYINTKVGTYYLIAIIDLFSRKVIGYKLVEMQDSINLLSLFVETFNIRGKPAGLIFHSDQGTQYTAHLFKEPVEELGVKLSYSSPGSPLDNAVAERFFASIKREELYQNKIESFKHCKEIVDEYIEYFNHYRPHEKLNNQTPQQFENNYYK